MSNTDLYLELMKLLASYVNDELDTDDLRKLRNILLIFKDLVEAELNK